MRKRIFFGLVIFAFCAASSAVFSQDDKLTKEQIIQIAINKAKDIGYKTEEMNLIYDEDNKKIKERCMYRGVSTYNEKTKQFEKDLPSTPEKEYPELKGRNYQAVYFGSKAIVKGGDLWVFIDKDTGDVIKLIRGK